MKHTYNATKASAPKTRMIEEIGKQALAFNAKRRTIPAEKPTAICTEQPYDAEADAAYWRKRTDEYSLQLAHTTNQAAQLAEALRNFLALDFAKATMSDIAPRIDKAVQALAAYEEAR